MGEHYYRLKEIPETSKSDDERLQEVMNIAIIHGVVRETHLPSFTITYSAEIHRSQIEELLQQANLID